MLSQSTNISKFSGTRKFTLRYWKFEINFNFEISRFHCIFRVALNTCRTKFRQFDNNSILVQFKSGARTVLEN